jgi:hypothetical protein
MCILIISPHDCLRKRGIFPQPRGAGKNIVAKNIQKEGKYNLPLCLLLHKIMITDAVNGDNSHFQAGRQRAPG